MEFSLLTGVINGGFLPEKTKDSKHLLRVGSMEDQSHSPLVLLSPYGRSRGGGGTCSVGSLSTRPFQATDGNRR